jgi:hypothetical protein
VYINTGNTKLESSVFRRAMIRLHHIEVTFRTAASSGERVHFKWFHTDADWEFHGGGVHNSNDIPAARSFDDGEERTFHTIFTVQINNLLVIVGALQEFKTSVQRTAVRGDHDLDAANGRIKWKSLHGTSLNGLGSGRGCKFADHAPKISLTISGDTTNINRQASREREFHLTSVANSDGVLSSGGFNDGTEWAHVTVFVVHVHLDGSVVRSLPQFNIGMERTSVRAKHDLNAFNVRSRKRPSAERSTLYSGGRQSIPDLLYLTLFLFANLSCDAVARCTNGRASSI